ncbi:MAG TPA: DegT/DnrJ/EryC1/StrS family aminotransferase [Armatimonadota bacterium]|jgi:dTDP-4-amino-4,6-dideoxygalactose transaminase
MSTLAILGGAPVRERPFTNWPVHGPEEEAALLGVLRSGRWSALSGEQVARFEAAFAAAHDARHGVAVSSGTVALRVALLAAGVRAGDEVIVPAYTFQATASAVVEANARPIFADIDAGPCTLSADAVERAATPRTRFLLPVHFAGLPADMDRIQEVAGRLGITVIEDAAQAHGAQHRGCGVGSIGAMGCFSFQASKNVNAAEGGIILTNNDHLAARCRAILNCGRGADADPTLLTIFGNYRMTEFQGAVLNCQLARQPEQAARRESNAALLRHALSGVPGIAVQTRPEYVTRHAYHLFAFRFDPEQWGVPREKAIRALNAEGIPATEGYTAPLYRQPMFSRQAFGPYSGAEGGSVDWAERCPVAERVCSREGAWIYQKCLLGSEDDTLDVARGFEKVWDLRGDLGKVEI